ncbi:triacylglycerol lipase [Necator americanus]|uniref:Triacylglycerol lipase n=1 Tax=Necator americanus TaxID=51031 RepID=W2THX9_NECAM|nr:triacylglycerol lipase [Necator americanus]ETN80756.1 triacylglycerol lipase [Necator americanus]
MLPSFALFSLLTFAGADFSPSFNAFLAGTYGKAFADRMARRDIGGHGSFGGGDHQEGFRTSCTTSRNIGARHHKHSRENGWKESEVYATTYGDGGKTPAPLVDMKCDYVKQVRWLIQAVAEFTKRRVDVIGYSMGSPVARKAILGGRCVDTGEALGPRLTALIDTFVSVAGANHGSFLCLVPFPGACNLINGLSCHSQFILNINKRQRYEGLHIYSIYSPQDDKVGHRNACGELTSSIAGSDQEFQVKMPK